MAEDALSLNLKLSGVSDLVKAIRDLDKALSAVNRKFQALSTSVTAAANKIKGAVSGIQAVGKAVSGSGAGTKPPIAGQAIRNTSTTSIAFSMVQGQWMNTLSKIFTHKMLGNYMNNNKLFQVASNFVGKQTGASPLTISGLVDGISDIVAGFLPLIAALALAVTAVVAFVLAVQKAAENFGAFYFATGGMGVNSYLHQAGIAGGKSAGEMANIAKDPIQAQILTRQLKIIEGMKSDKAAAIYASRMGIDQELAMGVRFQDPFLKFLNSLNIPGAGDGRASAEAGSAFKSSLAALGDAVLQFLDYFAPVLKMVATQITTLATIIRLIGQALSWFKNALLSALVWILKLIHANSAADAVEKLRNSADGASEAIDRMTRKTGTFGGGERARGAIPSAWTYYSYQGKLIDMADYLGAFEF